MAQRHPHPRLSSCEDHGEAKGQIPGPSLLSWGLREELGIWFC